MHVSIAIFCDIRRAWPKSTPSPKRPNIVLRATFPGIRESVKDLLGKQMDALARQFAATHDMKVKEEIERLAKDYGELNKPWRFVVK